MTRLPELVTDALSPQARAALAAWLFATARLCPECGERLHVRTSRKRIAYVRCACGFRGKVVNLQPPPSTPTVPEQELKMP